MSSRQDTFAKRRREAELKERARVKQERRVAKRNEPRTIKGPEIAWGEAVPAVLPDEAAPVEVAPATSGVASSDDLSTPTE
jgi:hypothetical protein